MPILAKIFCLGSRVRQPTTPLTVSEQVVTKPEVKLPIDAVNGVDQKSPPPPPYPPQVQHGDDELEGTAISRWFRDTYGRFLMKKATKAKVIVLLLAFWGVSAYGCYNLRQGLEPIRLLVDDSYGIPYYRNIETYFWDYGQQVQVVIFNPGDLSNATQRRAVLDVVEAFSKLPHATGHEGVDFWLSAFDNFLWRSENIKLAGLTSEQFYEKLNWFLYSFKENIRYRMDVAFRNGNGPGGLENPIVAVRAMVGIKGFNTLTGQQDIMDSFRALANSYSSSFNISTFHVMFLFVDQYEDIWPNVAQVRSLRLDCRLHLFPLPSHPPRAST